MIPSRSGEEGGVTLRILLCILLFCLAFGGYKVFQFYQRNVAPIVTKASTAARSLNLLNPYEITKDPQTIKQWLYASLRIELPKRYIPGFGLRVQTPGNRYMQVTTFIPENAQAADIFEGGKNTVRFSPGRHTFFLAAQFNQAGPEEMQEMIEKVAGSPSTAASLNRVFIDAGGREVAALRGSGDLYGQTDTLVYVFLDDSRMLFAIGPKEGFDEVALKEVLAAIVAAHPANELLYQHPKPETVQPPSNDPCGIPGLQGDYDVVAISVPRGSLSLDVTIDRSGRDVSQEDVVVGATQKPVVLVLMGADPIVWRVGRTEDARIAGILAQGACHQAVIGLPKSVLITRYSAQDGPNACPHFRATDKGSGDYSKADRRIKELFGRRISTFLTKKGGEYFAVGEVRGEVTYSKDVKLGDIAYSDNVMPGSLKGIAWLARHNFIRPASDNEVQAWLMGAAAAARVPLAEYQKRMRWRLEKDHVYIVLKPLELPSGLGGANARSFILPPGTPMPTGDPGHCTFLHMDSFNCSGVGCT